MGTIVSHLFIRQLSVHDDVLKYIHKHASLLTPDHSNYARGRRRVWLGLEAPLTSNRTFQPVHPLFSYHSPLWKWLDGFCRKYLGFVPEVGLLHVGGADCSDPEETPDDGRGGECGITTHRDAAYADFKAVGINVAGTATFGYREVYPYIDRWSAPKECNGGACLQHVHMTPGTCVVFNCKNPHFGQAGPNRWCINAWRISEKRRKDFHAALGNSGADGSS